MVCSVVCRVALVGALLVFASCAPGASSDPSEVVAPRAPAAGHQRMLDLLRDIAEEARRDNPYLGQSIATKIRADLAAMPETAPIPQRWYLNVLLGMQELRLGNEDLAIEHYNEAYRLLGQSKDPVPREHFIRTAFETGVAYMRQAETANCVSSHTSESCIFPVRGGGVHRFAEPARSAIGAFGEVLDVAQPQSWEFLRARWLLNIAHMTVGSYPAGVARKHLIPPELFASDQSFPRFPEIAPRLGLNTFDHAGGAVADDFDGDGFLDIMVSTSNAEGQLRYYANNGDGTFSERTVAAGLLGLVGGLNLIQADYDNDGWVDVLVLRGGWWRQFGRHPNSLLRNNGDGTFSDVTFASGIGEPFYPTQTAAWADYDNDGDLDLYVGNEADIDGSAIRYDDAPTFNVRAPCQLFRNDGDGTFTDVAAAAGVENLRYSKAVVWGDYDGDRYPDLYVSNAGGYNRLYRNQGDGTFTDVAPELGVKEPGASFPAWFWDVDNDGALDLFVAAYGAARTPADVGAVAASYLGLPRRGDLARLYRNDGRGGFRDVAGAYNLTRVTIPMGANFGDLDNDGYPDFYLGTGYPQYDGLVPNVMYRNQGGTRFADVTTEGGFGHLQKGHGVVFADLDNDGDQDVYEQIGGAWNGDAYGNALFHNPGFGNHWIKVALRGVVSNRLGVGARIRAEIVEAGRRRSVYHWIGTGGSFGGNPLRAEMGLGAATTIEVLEVYWPTSDTTQRFEAVPVDRMIEITEGDETYRDLPLEAVSFGG